jgi:LysR family transcriptional activator of mexEF-oprN operon
LRALATTAPGMRVIAVPVQFRSVGARLASGGLDGAITVADELPAGVRRQALFRGGFVCLFDPRHLRVKRRLTERDYFAYPHVVVSYNEDLRGIVEDLLQKQRRVRCSVSSFANVGALVDGAALLATVPALVARQLRVTRPHLETRPVPFALPGAAMELLWPATVEDDEACRFLRACIVDLAQVAGATGRAPRG